MNRIREVRKAKKLSQTELAEMLHVHQTAVSQWENGKTEPDVDFNACSALKSRRSNRSACW